MRTRTASAALGPLLLLTACDPSMPVVLTDCIRHEHCDAGEVCFLSRCVNPGDSQALVFADIVPANTSIFLPQIDSEARDLSDGLRQNVSLESAIHLSGTITAGDSSREGFLEITRVRDPDSPALPSAAYLTKALVGPTGFEIELGPDADYIFTFIPSETHRPPYTWEAPIATFQTNANADLTYPADDAMVKVSGIVQAEAGVPSTFKTDVLVEGTGNPNGGSPSHSTSDETDGAGIYNLVFPPGASTFRIGVRPGSNTFVPTAEAELTLVTQPTPTEAGELEPFVLDLVAGQLEGVTAILNSDEGEPVASANLSFFGIQVGKGTFTATATSDSQGRAQATLLPGLYSIVVSPTADDNFALTTATVCVAAIDDVPDACSDGTLPDPMPLIANEDQPVTIEVRNMIEIRGTVASSDGFAVMDARVTMRLRNTRVTREFTVNTDERGEFTLAVDPGSTIAEARYDLIVEPVQSSDLPLPRQQETIPIGTALSQTITVTLDEAALVYGQALDLLGTPVRDVRIGIYSVELGTLDAPLLVGLGQTNEDGEYVIPIPTHDTP